MILAAGRGERLRPLTDHTPKPLLSVGGRPLIDWHLQALARAGMTHVVINLAWLGAQIRAHVGDGARYGLTVLFSDEGPVPLETGGGIFHALRWLGSEPFWVVNGDVWSDFDFARVPPLPADADARLVMVPNPPQHPRGDFALRDGVVVDEGEGLRLTYSGIGQYRPSLFAGCTPGRFKLLPLLQRAAAARRLYGLRYDGLWFDVGTPERLAELDARLASGAIG
ncbi:MAG: nucleotidyltransferase family protein [Steroidobacteraceae bacterium]|nr:nucleotidyltransferase family protein [Steroidobacteraceae bacterium]MDW8258988.1 nucleotidyltransferase family protein [Gammaproteobacteria bacterium]